MPNFWQLATTPTLKIQWFPLGTLILRQKIFLILYPPLENFTTSIAIMMLINRFKMTGNRVLAKTKPETSWFSFVFVVLNFLNYTVISGIVVSELIWVIKTNGLLLLVILLSKSSSADKGLLSLFKRYRLFFVRSTYFVTY